MSTQQTDGNGDRWLKAWRVAVASLMVAAVVGAWTSAKEFAALTEAVGNLKAAVDRIDDRVLYLERGGRRVPWDTSP